jgi:transposase
VAQAAPGDPGPARRRWGYRLVRGDRRRGQRPGEKGGESTGPNPVDRGKPGSKLHVLSDATGLPLLVGVSAANTHDSQALRRLVMGIPAIRSRGGPRRRRPDKLRADKGYDFDSHRAWLRSRGITPRIARRGIDTGEHLGRYRWKIERTIAWLSGYRRLTLRYERHADHFAAFLCLAATLTCWKKTHHVRHALTE